MPVLKVPPAAYATPPRRSPLGDMLSEDTATSAARSVPHATSARSPTSAPPPSLAHVMYGAGLRSQTTSTSVCITSKPRPTIRAISPTRIAANFCQLFEACELSPTIW